MSTLDDRLGAALAYTKRARVTDGPVCGCAGYLFEAGRRVKVGISEHPVARARTLTLASGERVKIRELHWFPDRAAARRWETAAHRALRHYRLPGEWFEEVAVWSWLRRQPIGPGKP